MKIIDIEIHLHVPAQRRDIEESANGLPDVIENFIEELIQTVLLIHDNIARESLVETTIRDANSSKPYMKLGYKHFALSDNCLIEIVCNDRLIAGIYSRRTNFNFTETSFFVLFPILDELRKNWLERKK